MRGSAFLRSLPAGGDDASIRAREARVLSAVRNGQALPIRWYPIDTSCAGHTGTFWVAGDTLRFGVPGPNDSPDDWDWVRVAVTPETAQRIADELGVLLPTDKILDLTWAEVRRSGVPLTPHLQDPVTATTEAMARHHAAIEAERAGRDGLLADVGKDWILTNDLFPLPGRRIPPHPFGADGAVNYGWHVVPTPATFAAIARHRAHPEEPYLGPYEARPGIVLWQTRGLRHNLRHVDYSQWIPRFVHPEMVVDGRKVRTADVLMSPELAGLVSYEGPLRGTRYPISAAPARNVSLSREPERLAGEASGPAAPSYKRIDLGPFALRFPNSFPDATLGTVAGDSDALKKLLGRFANVSLPGLCGGWAATSLDHWYAGVPAPKATKTPAVSSDLGAYILARQVDTLSPGHLARFASLLANPSDTSVARASADAFEEVRASIDAGKPVLLGLTPHPWTLDPAKATNAHQVIAHGYAVNEDGGKTVLILDPNRPLVRDNDLYQAPGSLHWVEPALGGPQRTWRAFFVESGYVPKEPPGTDDRVASSDAGAARAWAPQPDPPGSGDGEPYYDRVLVRGGDLYEIPCADARSTRIAKGADVHVHEIEDGWARVDVRTAERSLTGWVLREIVSGPERRGEAGDPLEAGMRGQASPMVRIVMDPTTPRRAGGVPIRVVLPEAAAPETSAGGPADALNAFTLDLYGRLALRRGNLVASPLSVAGALAMALGGAKGSTAAEVEKVLRLAGSPPEAAASVGALLQRTAEVPEGCTLRIANQLFADRRYAVDRGFLERTREAFGAALERLDFRQAPHVARQAINGWIAQQTNDRIRDLIPEGGVDRLTRLVLADAIYFLGTWEEPFEVSATRPEPFYGPQGPRDVPMMHRTGHFRYLRRGPAAEPLEPPPGAAVCPPPGLPGPGVQVLDLPYRGGLVMTLILPDAHDGLAAVEAAMSAPRLWDWLGTLSSTRVAVSLPRFEMKPAGVSLSEALGVLGMPSAFDEARADFTGIADPPDPRDRLFISDVFHKAFVKVDEQGTEAAAATGVVMAAKAISVERRPVEFRADHPFLFLIRDARTGVIVFIGRVEEPVTDGGVGWSPQPDPAGAGAAAGATGRRARGERPPEEDTASASAALQRVYRVVPDDVLLLQYPAIGRYGFYATILARHGFQPSDPDWFKHVDELRWVNPRRVWGCVIEPGDELHIPDDWPSAGPLAMPSDPPERWTADDIVALLASVNTEAIHGRLVAPVGRIRRILEELTERGIYLAAPWQPTPPGYVDLDGGDQTRVASYVWQVAPLRLFWTRENAEAHARRYPPNALELELADEARSRGTRRVAMGEAHGPDAGDPLEWFQETVLDPLRQASQGTWVGDLRQRSRDALKDTWVKNTRYGKYIGLDRPEPSSRPAPAKLSPASSGTPPSEPGFELYPSRGGGRGAGLQPLVLVPETGDAQGDQALAGAGKGAAIGAGVGTALEVVPVVGPILHAAAVVIGAIAGAVGGAAQDTFHPDAPAGAGWLVLFQVVPNSLYWGVDTINTKTGNRSHPAEEHAARLVRYFLLVSKTVPNGGPLYNPNDFGRSDNPYMEAADSRFPMTDARFTRRIWLAEIKHRLLPPEASTPEQAQALLAALRLTLGHMLGWTQVTDHFAEIRKNVQHLRALAGEQGDDPNLRSILRGDVTPRLFYPVHRAPARTPAHRAPTRT